MVDSSTGEKMFSSFSVELSCQACKDAGKSADCKHMLHLVPDWQSSTKHIRLKTIMQDRPDLIQSNMLHNPRQYARRTPFTTNH